MRRLHFSRALICLLLPLAATAGPVFNVVDLGAIGGPMTSAQAVNGDGSAAGFGTDAFGNFHAFATAGLSATGLEGDQPSAMAWDINDSGDVAGLLWMGGMSYAALWRDGAAQTLAGAGSSATGINDLGQVTGMYTTASGEGHAFLMSGGSLLDLGTLPGGDWSAGYGVNDAGQVAGYGSVGGRFRAFLWSPDLGLLKLGTLGGANSYGMAVNAAGVVAGHAQTTGGYLHATVWSDGRATDLGTLGGSSSYAYGINAAGDVAGYSYTAGGGGPRAFLHHDGTLHDLNSLIAADSGWVLTHAYDINDHGQIVGAGLLNGVPHAFRLDPVEWSSVRSVLSGTGGRSIGDGAIKMAGVPEPGTWVMMLLGIALCVLGAWGSRHIDK